MAASEFLISPENIGSFMFGGRPFRVWAAVRNEGRDNPRLWQFRYDPLLLPVTNPDGTLRIRRTSLGTGARLQITIAIDTPELGRRAHAEVERRYPRARGEILETNVTPLKIESIDVGIPDLTVVAPKAVLRDPTTEFFLGDPAFQVTIDVPDKETEELVTSILPVTRVDYRLGFDAKTVKQNVLKVRYSDLKKSNLYVRLNGVGDADVAVHRDDLRKLSEGIFRTIAVQGTVEDPARIDLDVFNQVLGELTKNVSSADFDEQKWRSTFNGDDLKPDVVTKTLNKMFTKQENEERWKYHVDADIQTKASLFEILSAEGEIKGSYDNEGLKRLLREHNVEAEFEGNRIVAKSIRLQQVNLGTFNSDAEFTSVMTFTAESDELRAGTLDLGLALEEADGSSGVATQGLPARLAELERQSWDEIGTIQAFGASERIPHGWLVCDGTAYSRTGEYMSLFEKIGVLWGAGDGTTTFNVPDLQGLFLRGLDSGAKRDEDFERPIGSIQRDSTRLPNTPFRTDQAPEHTHLDPTWNGAPGPFEVATEFRGPGGVDYVPSAPTGAAGAHSHQVVGGDSETRPVNAAVLFIIRAK